MLPRLHSYHDISKFLLQATLIFILIFTFVDMAKGKATKYNDYIFPSWADGLGLLISFVSVLFIPALAAYQVCNWYDIGVFQRCGSQAQNRLDF